MSEAAAFAVQHLVPPISLRRRMTDHVMTGVAVLTVILVLVPLVAIFGYLVYKGVASLNWAFLTQTPKPPGEAGGGVANGIVGSAMILGIVHAITHESAGLDIRVLTGDGRQFQGLCQFRYAAKFVEEQEIPQDDPSLDPGGMESLERGLEIGL